MRFDVMAGQDADLVMRGHHDYPLSGLLISD